MKELWYPSSVKTQDFFEEQTIIECHFILLRGLTRESRHWGAFPKILQTSFSNSQVVTLDLPGVGSEVDRSSPWSISEITEDLRSRLFHLSPHPPRVLVGISLGGMVALDWLARYPEDFEAGVVINTSVGGVNSFLDRMRFSAVKKILPLLRMKDLEKREKEILKLTTRLQKDSEAVVREWVEIAETRPVKFSVFWKQLYAARRFRAPQISKPLLVLSSEKDELVNPKCSQSIAALYQARHSSHREAGHDLPLEDPYWMAQEIHAWLSPLSFSEIAPE